MHIWTIDLSDGFKFDIFVMVTEVAFWPAYILGRIANTMYDVIDFLAWQELSYYSKYLKNLIL